MKRFSTILKYLRDYKSNILLYILFIILSIIFSVVSLATLPTFLKLLFGLEQPDLHQPVFTLSASGVYEYVKYILSDIIINQGKVAALAYICITVIISVFFKNIFLYFSYYVLAPIRNGVMTKLRADLYNKILVFKKFYFFI